MDVLVGVGAMIVLVWFFWNRVPRNLSPHTSTGYLIAAIIVLLLGAFLSDFKLAYLLIVPLASWLIAVNLRDFADRYEKEKDEPPPPEPPKQKTREEQIEELIKQNKR